MQHLGHLRYGVVWLMVDIIYNVLFKMMAESRYPSFFFWRSFIGMLLVFLHILYNAILLCSTPWAFFETYTFLYICAGLSLSSFARPMYLFPTFAPVATFSSNLILLFFRIVLLFCTLCHNQLLAYKPLRMFCYCVQHFLLLRQVPLYQASWK